MAEGSEDVTHSYTREQAQYVSGPAESTIQVLREVSGARMVLADVPDNSKVTISYRGTALQVKAAIAMVDGLLASMTGGDAVASGSKRARTDHEPAAAANAYCHAAPRHAAADHPPPPAMVPTALPPGWHANVDGSSGHAYYSNPATGQTQWHHPGGQAAPSGYPAGGGQAPSCAGGHYAPPHGQQPASSHVPAHGPKQQQPPSMMNFSAPTGAHQQQGAQQQQPPSMMHFPAPTYSSVMKKRSECEEGAKLFILRKVRAR